MQQKTILRDINFQAPAGQITAILVRPLLSYIDPPNALVGAFGSWKILITPATRGSILECRSLGIFSRRGFNNVQRCTANLPNRVDGCLCRTGR